MTANALSLPFNLPLPMLLYEGQVAVEVGYEMEGDLCDEVKGDPRDDV